MLTVFSKLLKRKIKLSRSFLFYRNIAIKGMKNGPNKNTTFFQPAKSYRSHCQGLRASGTDCNSGVPGKATNLRVWRPCWGIAACLGHRIPAPEGTEKCGTDQGGDRGHQCLLLPQWAGLGRSPGGSPAAFPFTADRQLLLKWNAGEYLFWNP